MTPESDLSVLQSLSAHLKLLLDAPEQLWRLLERHNYLHAAWLFLISRVVYRSLMRDESKDEYDSDVSWEKSGIDVSVSILDLLALNKNLRMSLSGTIPSCPATVGHDQPV